MNFETQYINQLEQLIIEKLLPVYSEYYILKGQPEPEIDVLTPLRKRKKLPALLNKNFPLDNSNQ